MFTKEPKTVVYCHAEDPGDMLSEFEGIIYYRGLPDHETIDSWIELYGADGILLCFDDLSGEFYNDKSSQTLISRVVHHNNLFLIVVGHNLFHNGKHARFAMLNYHGILLTRACRDLNQYAVLGRQIWGAGYGRQFVEAFIDATELKADRRAGYLFVSTHPIYSRRDALVFANIFPDEKPLIVYRPE